MTVRNPCARRLLICVALAIAPLHAQVRTDSTCRCRRIDPFAGTTVTAEPAATGFAFYVENDVLGFTTDQNYTGGFAVSSGGRWVAESGMSGPLSRLERFTDWLTRMRSAHGRRYLHEHNFIILGGAFTPVRDSLAVVTPVINDRPYASVFGFKTRQVSVGRTKDPMQRLDRAVSSELSIAALGWNLAKALQTDLHRTLRRNSGKSTPVDPLGWPNQISNGGEPTLLYRMGVEDLLAGKSPVLVGRHGQLTWSRTIDLGYYDNVALGVSGRYGWLITQFWQFSSNPLNSQQQKSSTGPQTNRGELYAFFGARGRAIAYNALLQGQFRKSAHTFSARQIERLVGEGETGVAASWPLFGGQLGLTWIALSGRTAEFKGPVARAHYWGAVHLSYSPIRPLAQ